MTVRTDIYTVDWDVSPRLIWIDISITEASAQDLYDTLVYLESQTANMDNDRIVICEGKSYLGPGQYTGLTVTLLNARYAFADRPGLEWVICNMGGGNVVAKASDLITDIYPRHPTAFVSADRTTSVSATLQELSAVQYASFNGYVTVDVINGTSGIGSTSQLIGTRQFPSNNIAHAKAITEWRGLGKTIFIVGDITLDADADIEGFTILGENVLRTRVNIDTEANVLGCEFRNAEISGTLDGGNLLEDCVVAPPMYYIEGMIKKCLLRLGTLTLGAPECQFIDCQSEGFNDEVPILDMDGAGVALVIRGHSGGLKLINKTGPESVNLAFESGELYVDETITNGHINVSGICAIHGHTEPDSIVRRLDVVSQVEIENTRLAIESIRPHHTGQGQSFYWDPTNGDDANSGRSTFEACKTFQHIHDHFIISGRHDIVYLVSESLTTINEQILITKDYVFLRGPGRAAILQPTINTAPTILATGTGVQIHGLQVNTADDSDYVAIKCEGSFPNLSNIWINKSGSHGIHCLNLDHAILCSLDIQGSTGHGICFENVIYSYLNGNNTIHYNSGNGIHVGGICHGVHVYSGTDVHKNGGYGVLTEVTTKETYLHPDTRVFQNVLGDILLQGTDNYLGSEEEALNLSEALHEELSVIDENVDDIKTIVSNLNGTRGFPF